MGEYGLELVTAPAVEPVSTEQARRWCQIVHQDDDEDLDTLVTAARVLLEKEFSRQICTATWRLVLEYFPTWKIRIPLGPVSSITSIQYVATDGTTTTLSSSLYSLDKSRDPAVITPAYGEVWPSTRCQPRAVLVTFVAGYGAADDVPKTIVQAIRMAVACWHAGRGDGAPGEELPRASRVLMRAHWSGQL